MQRLILVLLAATAVWGQAPRAAAPPKSPKDAAPVDLAGYWV